MGHQPPPAHTHIREQYVVAIHVTRNPGSDVRHIIILGFALVHFMKYRIISNNCHVQQIGGPLIMMENEVRPPQACYSWNRRLSDASPPGFIRSGLHQGYSPIMPGYSSTVSPWACLKDMSQ